MTFFALDDGALVQLMLSDKLPRPRRNPRRLEAPQPALSIMENDGGEEEDALAAAVD